MYKVPSTQGALWRAAPFRIITSIVSAHGPGGQAKALWLGQASGMGSSVPLPSTAPTPHPVCSLKMKGLTITKWGVLQATQRGLGLMKFQGLEVLGLPPPPPALEYGQGTCSQFPSRGFWLRGSEGRPLGGREGKGTKFCDQKLPQAFSGTRRNYLCGKTGCLRGRCLVELVSLKIHCHLLPTPPDQLARVVWFLCPEPVG